MAEETLANEYVKDYYDKQIGDLEERYVDYRWNSDDTGRFDYAQTTRALTQALGSRRYKNAVEIGPGDGVWTRLLKEHVDGPLYLIEQSESMLAQAKKELRDITDITYEHADWDQSTPPAERDLVFAIRCFEYFTDKPAGLEKMYRTLKPGGRLILVTKNADLYTSVNVQGKTLHSDQVSKLAMCGMLRDAGFTIEAVYPATFRWKIKYRLFRFVFDLLHVLAVRTGGLGSVPVLTKYATESFTYVARK